MRCMSCIVLGLAIGLSWSVSAAVFVFSDPGLPGLSAEAEFSLPTPDTLVIRLSNTSTAAPGGIDNAGQILTGISFDLGVPGYDCDCDPMILDGTVVIGPGSASINFNTGSYGPGYDVSGEWGYGNTDGTGALANFASSNAAVATPFGGPNLDGPSSVDGPQGGVVASPPVVALGGLGAISNEVIITLSLSEALANLDFLYQNGVRVEFGSDAAFITIVPEPAGVALMALGGTLLVSRRRR